MHPVFLTCALDSRQGARLSDGLFGEDPRLNARLNVTELVLQGHIQDPGRGVSTVAVTRRMRVCYYAHAWCVQRMSAIACVSGLLQYVFPAGSAQKTCWLTVPPTISHLYFQWLMQTIHKGGFRLIPDCKPRKRALLGGLGACPPRKVLKNSYW